MNDITEHGANLFVQHILAQEKIASCKEEIVLVTSQLVSFKEFSGKLNLLIREIAKLNSFDNEKEIIIYISKHFKKIFSSERVHLWFVDSVSFFIELFNFFKKIKAYRPALYFSQ